MPRQLVDNKYGKAFTDVEIILQEMMEKYGDYVLEEQGEITVEIFLDMAEYFTLDSTPEEIGEIRDAKIDLSGYDIVIGRDSDGLYYKTKMGKTYVDSDESGDEARVEAKGKYILTMGAVPNPDYPRSDYNGSINIKPFDTPVSSVEEASKKVSRFISENELGGGNFIGGDVKDQDGKRVARISYNGRIWLPGSQYFDESKKDIKKEYKMERKVISNKEYTEAKKDGYSVIYMYGMLPRSVKIFDTIEEAEAYLKEKAEEYGLPVDGWYAGESGYSEEELYIVEVEE